MTKVMAWDKTTLECAPRGPDAEHHKWCRDPEVLGPVVQDFARILELMLASGPDVERRNRRIAVLSAVRNIPSIHHERTDLVLPLIARINEQLQSFLVENTANVPDNALMCDNRSRASIGLVFCLHAPETSVSGGTWDRLAISVADIYTAFGKSSFAGVAELLHAKAVERLWDQWVFVAIKRSDGSVMAYDPSATSTRLDSAAITKVYFAPVEDRGGVVTLDFSLIACNVVDCVVLSVGFRVTPTTPY